MSPELIQTLAKRGAEERLKELAVEQAALWQAFPDLAPLVNGRPREAVLKHMAKMRAARGKKK